MKAGGRGDSGPGDFLVMDDSSSRRRAVVSCGFAPGVQERLALPEPRGRFRWSSLPRPGAALALLLLVAGPEWAHAGWPSAPLSKPAWRRDLQVLAEDLPRRHRNLYHSVTREAFARAVAELDSRIARLDDDAIAVGLMRIVAMAGDGHTVIRLPRTRERYPLVLSWIDSELRVTATTPA